MPLFKKKQLDSDKELLIEAHARIQAEKEKIEQEKRLYKILVEDPLDFDTLVRIGKKVGVDMLEVTNKYGSIARFYFKTNTLKTTSVAEEQATKEGLW
jgi:hypothetical protein